MLIVTGVVLLSGPLSRHSYGIPFWITFSYPVQTLTPLNGLPLHGESFLIPFRLSLLKLGWPPMWTSSLHCTGSDTLARWLLCRMFFLSHSGSTPHSWQLFYVNIYPLGLHYALGHCSSSHPRYKRLSFLHHLIALELNCSGKEGERSGGNGRG